MDEFIYFEYIEQDLELIKRLYPAVKSVFACGSMVSGLFLHPGTTKKEYKRISSIRRKYGMKRKTGKYSDRDYFIIPIVQEKIKIGQVDILPNFPGLQKVLIWKAE